MVNNGIKRTSLYIVRIALISALLTSAKFALSFIPNVEIITTQIIVLSSAFGLIYMLPATLVFCSMEILIYGVGSWAVLYFVYWPFLAIISSILLRRERIFLAVLISAVCSFLFGLISACIDTLFCVYELTTEELEIYFTAYYLRGISFDVVHIVSNTIISIILYKPLVGICSKVMPKEYNAHLIRSRKLIYLDYVYVSEKKEG